MSDRRVRVGVLGSARIEPPDPRHAAAIEVGRLLGAAGFDVVTGGYGGLMAAVSEGAAAAGARVVGLPMRAWSELTVNRWVSETVEADDFFERLRELSRCDALVALDGGVGTLAEVSVTWANLQTDTDVTPPLVLVGPMWASLLPILGETLVVDDRDLGLLRPVAGPADVVDAVHRALADRRQRGERRG